ncbi:MAG: hypothetical protein HY695_34970 [Deltaproteobacteria bacterium]|nr:hypothetical protein [Deltaproteobacteria bacterium]
MRERIEILTTLQSVDREIRNKSNAKTVLLDEIQKTEGEIQTKRAEIELFRGNWAEKDRLRQGKEKLLQEEGRKTTDKRMRMTRIKNIKELQALQREIDQMKQSNSQLEEELIKLMEETEMSFASLQEKEQELARLEQEWTEKRAEIHSQLTGIEGELAEAAATRRQVAAKLDENLIERYELIFSRRGGTAVVEVSEGICQGCHMNIPYQLLNEILKSDKLIFCPSCHRILYLPETASTEKQL